MIWLGTPGLGLVRQAVAVPGEPRLGVARPGRGKGPQGQSARDDREVVARTEACCGGPGRDVAGQATAWRGWASKEHGITRLGWVGLGPAWRGKGPSGQKSSGGRS